MFLAAGLCFVLSTAAQAQEITAIDFNGDLLGKVIPDGKVVGFDNQLIGNVTADSLILNFDGRLIGGVVPQGIAIGNDARQLGKVSNDGSVRLPSGQVVGKVLPNGLVVNDYFDVIGAVLFPGLVYSDEGKTVGRVTGDGLYTNLQGQQIGLVTPDGYAYRRAGNDYVLDGRLISSKMVVSLNGEFIGSVNPGGTVSDFDSQNIGHIKANGYVYNDENQVIGKIVKSGYAFDNNGFYLGFVTYNGEVIDNEKLVGRLRADGNIVDENNRVIGYSLDISATATDFQGRYLGRLMPNGNLARAKELSGLIGARGIVLDASGNAVGQTVGTGPVFDFKGTLRGHALANGVVISLNGTPVGYMVHDTAYDLSGRIIGAVLQNRLAFSNNNSLLGLSGINSMMTDNGGRYYLSPFGYVFNPEGGLEGSNLPLTTVYSPYGGVVGQTDFTGQTLNNGGAAVGRLNAGGYAVNAQNQLVGSIIKAAYTVGTKQFLGHLSQENLVIDAALNIVAKVLPDNSVVQTDTPDSLEYMPQIGTAYNQQVVTDFVGNFKGYTDINANVYDLNGSKIGRVAERGYVLDNNGLVVGRVQGYESVVNDACELVGVYTPRGDVQNFRGVYLGKMLGNGLLISDSASVAGFAVRQAPVIDFSGKIIGFSNQDGIVRNFAGDRLGCLSRRGQIRNADKLLTGSIVEYAPAIDFQGNIIGRAVLDGTIIDEENQIVGYQQPDGNINSVVGLPIGNLFKYTVAFDMENRFLGRVLEDGSVINGSSENVGQVDFEGYVIFKGGKIGYALYDFYVYDASGNPVGYISRSGDVVSFGNQNLGVIDRGFLLDASGQVIGRGNRDYMIRNEDKTILGELQFDGEVLDNRLEVVGRLGQGGDILNRNNEVIAHANALQYYSKVDATEVNRKMVFDKDGNFIGYLDENGNIVDRNGNIIGHLNENGMAVDSEGNVIGEPLNQKAVYDKEGRLIGMADEYGNVRDANGKIIGKVTDNGDVVDANGNIIGGIGANWYEKAPQPVAPRKEQDVPAVDVLDGKTYRKSLGIALTPDGEYLGEILEDGSVVNEQGRIVGRRMPDGLIIDEDGELIGIEESKKPAAADGGIFVPPGTFGAGGAYGTGTGPAGNLGPGGGYGPGERYDPARQAALNAAMAERRKNITVGKISNGMRKEAFDGMQKDWSEQGVGKVLSSWRVDLSEMIFADKPIPAVISRAIDSNHPAPITAFVERNVYAEEGRNVIIPAGSRLIGSLGSVTASSEATSESARVQITWERLIRPDGSLFVFQGLTADAQGRGGALGYVDQQLFKKYTLPVLTSSLTSATSYFMAPKEESSTDNETPRQQAANDARQNFLNEMNQVFDEILADKSSIRPLSYVPAGTRIIVFPNVDLWLRTVERDQDDSMMLEKPTILIDDGEAAARREKYLRESANRSSGTPVSTSDVVYDADSDVEAQKATPLVTPRKKSNNTSSTAGTYNLAPPPPPPSGGSTSSGSSSNTDNSVPALF